MNITARQVALSLMGLCAVAGAARGGGGLTAAEEASYQVLLARPICAWTHPELATFLDLHRRRQTKTAPGNEVAFFAHQGLGQPFHGAAGIFQLSASNCVTFTERCVALACAADWDAHYKLTLRLRHREGVPTFLERNFFMLHDWAPNNAWLLSDVTAELGVPVTSFDHVVYPKRFYATLDFGEDETPLGQAKAAAKATKIESLPDRVVRSETYVPVEVLEDAVAKVQDGDIWLVVRERSAPGLKPWYDSDHMGVFHKPTPDAITLIHSVPPAVREDTLADFTVARPWVRGFKILRLRTNARAIARAEISRLAGTIPEYATGYDPNGLVAFADPPPAPKPPTTQPACTLTAIPLVISSACCLRVSVCPGDDRIAYAWTCVGACPDNLVCAATGQQPRLIYSSWGCEGHCKNLPFSCRTIGLPVIIEGPGPVKCECLKRTDAP